MYIYCIKPLTFFVPLNASFHQTPHMLTSDNNYQRYSSFKVQKREAVAVFYWFSVSSCSVCTNIVSDHKPFLFSLMPAFTRHPICWPMIINTRDIPVLRSEKHDAATIFCTKMTLWLSFVLTMTNYDSTSLSWVSAFRRHPKCWILMINSRDILVLRSIMFSGP